MASFYNHLGFIFAIGIPAMVVLILITARKQQLARLKKLTSCLSGDIPSFSLAPVFYGDYLGIRFAVMLAPASEGSGEHLQISVYKETSLRLRLYRESYFSQIGKKIGLLREVEINDPLFDEKYLIFSNQPKLAINYLQSREVKDAINELFCRNFGGLVIDGRKMTIQRSLSHEIAPSSLLAALQKLIFLARKLYF